jgi:hypothetical protein
LGELAFLDQLTDLYHECRANPKVLRFVLIKAEIGDTFPLDGVILTPMVPTSGAAGSLLPCLLLKGVQDVYSLCELHHVEDSEEHTTFCMSAQEQRREDTAHMA